MEECRERMYAAINKNGLNHSDTISASQELDKEILEQMLKDPKVENIYLKQVIKAKDCKIAELEETIKSLRSYRRIKDLAEVAVMLNEVGMPAQESVKLSMCIGQVKGI